MDKKKVPFQKTVFVCVNDRVGSARKSCGAAGLELCESLKHAVKEKGLKGKVRVAKSGCLDLCEQGPNAFVYPEGEWLSHLTQADVPGIIDKFQNP